jgi:hypothetical protein
MANAERLAGKLLRRDDKRHGEFDKVLLQLQG